MRRLAQLTRPLPGPVNLCLQSRHGDVDGRARSRLVPPGSAAWPARGRDRRGAWRPCRRRSARRARLPGHRPGKARRARRPRLGVPPGWLHLRRRPDHHHRAVPVRGAVAALRPRHGRRCRRCGRSRRSTASGSTTARRSTTPATPPRCAPRWRVSRPATSMATSASCTLSEAICRVGFEQLGDVPFGCLDRHGARRARPDAAGRAIAACMRLVARFIKDARLRIAFSFHPLLIGGNPFTTSAIYSLIAVPRAPLGRAFRHGRHGPRWSTAWSALIRGPGRQHPLQRRGGARSSSPTAAATGVRLGLPARPIAADIVVSNADSAWTYRHLLPQGAQRRWTDRSGSNRARYSMGLFVWYFGTSRQLSTTCAHHTILLGPRYRDLLRDIFERKVLADDFSLYLHRPTATDPVAGAARLRRVLRAVAGAEPRRRHRLDRGRPNRIAGAIAQASGGDAAAGPRAPRRDLARA